MNLASIYGMNGFDEKSNVLSTDLKTRLSRGTVQISISCCDRYASEELQPSASKASCRSCVNSCGLLRAESIICVGLLVLVQSEVVSLYEDWGCGCYGVVRETGRKGRSARRVAQVFYRYIRRNSSLDVSITSLPNLPLVRIPHLHLVTDS